MSRRGARMALQHRQAVDGLEAAGNRNKARRDRLGAALEHAQREAEKRVRDVTGRVALALSILQHRPFCDDCRPHIDDARHALLGASITDLMGGVSEHRSRGTGVGVAADTEQGDG